MSSTSSARLLRKSSDITPFWQIPPLVAKTSQIVSHGAGFTARQSAQASERWRRPGALVVVWSRCRDEELGIDRVAVFVDVANARHPPGLCRLPYG